MKLLNSFALLLALCVLTFGPPALSQAVAGPPVNATLTLTDAAGNPLSYPVPAGVQPGLRVSFTNTNPADVPATPLTASLLVTTMGTNLSVNGQPPTNGTRTTPVTLLAKPAVTYDVTATYDIAATGITAVGTLPGGITATATGFHIAPPTLAGGASGFVWFPVSLPVIYLAAPAATSSTGAASARRRVLLASR